MKKCYIAKHQELSDKASSLSYGVQVEKNDMVFQGHRAKIAVVPIKKYAYKSNDPIKIK